MCRPQFAGYGTWNVPTTFPSECHWADATRLTKNVSSRRKEVRLFEKPDFGRAGCKSYRDLSRELFGVCSSCSDRVGRLSSLSPEGFTNRQDCHDP